MEAIQQEAIPAKKIDDYWTEDSTIRFQIRLMF